MKAIVEGYFTALKIAIGLLLLAMMTLVFGNVVLRYVFNTGIASAEEVSRWCFVWMVFLGAIIGMREHGHLGIDMMVRALPVVGRKVCFALTHVLMIYACILLIIGSWQQAAINLAVVSPASGMSMALFYGVGLVFGTSTLAILLYELWKLFTGRMRDEELVAVLESEDVIPEAVRSPDITDKIPDRASFMELLRQLLDGKPCQPLAGSSATQQGREQVQ